MGRGHAAAALLALAVCIACTNAAPTSSEQTALEVPEGPSNGCYYNFQHYGEGDRIMTNEPCLNCTCHNRMLMCYLRVCPFTKPIGQDCTIEKRADQCCPIVTCPDVPVDLLTSTSTSSPTEYGATGLGKLDKYGCSINGKFFPEGSKVPPSPNKPCEHCYCIRNMTTCVMQECTLHVDGCTPIYLKDVCCPVRYSCDHPEDEIPLLDDMTTTVRPTPGFLLTTTTMVPITQPSQSCIHDDQIVPDGALIKTEKACEHCYCMKGDIVCVVQECGTPMENEGKSCASLPPRPGQCCPDTYICEGDEITTEISAVSQEIITAPPRRGGVEGSGYRNEPDEPYTVIPPYEIDSEGSGEEHLSTMPANENKYEKESSQVTESSTVLDNISEMSTELDRKQQNTGADLENSEKYTDIVTTESSASIELTDKITTEIGLELNVQNEHKLTTNGLVPSSPDMFTTQTPLIQEDATTKFEKTTQVDDILDETTLKEDDLVPEKGHQITLENKYQVTTQAVNDIKTILPADLTTLSSYGEPIPEVTIPSIVEIKTPNADLGSDSYTTTTQEKFGEFGTTSVNPLENEIHESDLSISSPGRIPGEGDCLLNSITYENNSFVPNINNCHTDCRCISSIIKCDPIICSAPPEYMKDCQPIYDSPESCCPTYVCSTKETIPPESHNQMSGSESTKPVLPSECSSSDCGHLETGPIPPDCLSDECRDKNKDSSQDKLVLPCEGNACVVDLPAEKQPDKELETPTKCEEDNGCVKPYENKNECSGSSCDMELGIECSGSACTPEITTESALSVSTIHERPISELSITQDVTDKIDTPHDTQNPEYPSQEQTIYTEGPEVYITEPIKSSADTTEESASHTKATESLETETIKDNSEISDYHTVSTDASIIELGDINKTDNPLGEGGQTLFKTTTLPEYFTHKVTEADYSNEVIHETVSENEDQTITYDSIQDTTTKPEQITTKINEQSDTENQIFTTELYEVRTDQPTVSIENEVQHTYLPKAPEYELKSTTTTTVDHSQNVNVDTLTDQTNTEPPTTENLMKDLVTIGKHPVSGVIEDATSLSTPAIVPIVENKEDEKLESETTSHPIGSLSSDAYESTSEYPTDNEHQINTESEKSSTGSPSIVSDTKDKVTDSVRAVTESDTEVTEAIDISSKPDVSKPISETTYDISTDRIYEKTEAPDIYTETSPTDQTKPSDEKTYITEKLEEVTERVEHTMTESTYKPMDVIVDNHQVSSIPTTESILTDDMPIEGIKTTESQHTSVTPGILVDETDINVTPNVISTEKNIETTFDNEEQLYTTPPAAIVPTPKETDTDRDTSQSSEIDKKTTERVITESEEQSTIASHLITDSGRETTISSLDIISSMSPIEQEDHTLAATDYTEKPESVTQFSIEPSTEEVQYTQDTNSIKQHDSDTTEGGYGDTTTSQVNIIQPDQDIKESPNLSTVLPLQTEEAQQNIHENHESDSLVTTIQYDLIESHMQPDRGLGTTNDYKEIGTTDSSIDNFDDYGKPTMDTKPQIIDTEQIVDEFEPITKSEEITTEKQDFIEMATEKLTTLSGVPRITDFKISDAPESYSTILEHIDLTTAPILNIESETTTSKLVSVVSTIGPEESSFTTESVLLEESAISTTPKASDVNIELTTAKEPTILMEVEQYLTTIDDKEDETTSSPMKLHTSHIIDGQIKIQSTTPLEDITSKQHDKEITEFEGTTQKDISNLSYTVSDLESSSVVNNIADSMTHEDDKFDSPILADDGLHTKRPEKQEPERNTDKYQEESGEPITEYQQNVVPHETSTFNTIQDETAFTPIDTENVSSPDTALSLVTDKVHSMHEEPLPEITPSHEVSAQDQPAMTTQISVSNMDDMLSSTEKSSINVPVLSASEPNEPTETDIKATSDELNIHTSDVTPTTEKISDVSQDDQSSEKSQPPVTGSEAQVHTNAPEFTIQSQTVTIASVQSNDVNEVTTEVILEKQTEAVIKESTVHTDQYDTTKRTVLEKVPEVELPTKAPLSSSNEFEPTTSVLTYTSSEKEQEVSTKPSIYPTTQSSNELYETTEIRNNDAQNEVEEQQVTQQPTIMSNVHEVTTKVSSDLVTDTETEKYTVTVGAGTNEDRYHVTTDISIEQASEKESEHQTTEQPNPISDISQTTDSMLIENQTTKELESEPVSIKDTYETSTLVVTEKQKESEILFVTKASTISDVYEETTLQTLDKKTIEEIVHETATEASMPTNDLSESATSSLPEKEMGSVSPFVGSSSESPITTLSSDIETTTFAHKIPDLTDDIHRTSEAILEYSETTPSHIELQEHTHHSIDEISSKMPIEGDVSTEQYISEEPSRGDVPNKDDSTNISPTVHYDEQDPITQKEEKPFATSTYVPPERENEIHNEVTTEIVSPSPSEAPEDDKYSVIPIETEKPISQNAEIEKPQTEKYIPDEFETPKPEIPDDKIVSSEGDTKVTTHPSSINPEEPTIPSEEFDKPDEKPIETGTDTFTDVPKPETNEQPPEDLPAPDFPTSGGGYGQEPDYGDSEDQAFGPGTCRYGGKVYVSAQQIPRDDPCDFCFCFRSDIICLQQSCPPPIHGCHEEPIQGFCCPRYECPVSMATTLNVTTTTTTTTTTLPPHFLPHAYKGAAQRRGCQIKGHTYKVGEVVRASSGPCLHCTCGGDGQMKCDPKACTPEPMLRQMIAAAVSAKRRR